MRRQFGIAHCEIGNFGCFIATEFAIFDMSTNPSVNRYCAMSALLLMETPALHRVFGLLAALLAVLETEPDFCFN